jgi:hypothetical protein
MYTSVSKACSNLKIEQTTKIKNKIQLLLLYVSVSISRLLLLFFVSLLTKPIFIQRGIGCFVSHEFYCKVARRRSSSSANGSSSVLICACKDAGSTSRKKSYC